MEYGSVACLSLHDSEEVLEQTDAAAYNAVIKELASENRALHVSMQGILSQNYDELTYDGDHPSPVGHQKIYERIKSELEIAGIL